MNFKSLSTAIALGCSHFLASAAVTSPITFEDLAVSAGPSSVAITSAGFIFETSANGLQSIFNTASEAEGPNNTSKFLAATIGTGLTSSFHAADHHAFNLLQLDISGYYNFQGQTLSVTVTGLKTDNTFVSTNLNVLPNSFESFSLTGFQNLQSVTFGTAGGSQYAAFDNLVTTPAAAVAPVPEPETYALMLGGLAALGWAVRRRKPV
jgi:hypothetical protein